MSAQSISSPTVAVDAQAATLSIIIVSYETREMTLECLRSVFAQTQLAGFEVLVVDNASKDGSAAAIAKKFPNLQTRR